MIFIVGYFIVHEVKKVEKNLADEQVPFVNPQLN